MQSHFSDFTHVNASFESEKQKVSWDLEIHKNIKNYIGNHLCPDLEISLVYPGGCTLILLEEKD